MSDQHIIRVSGYLEFLEAGDCVMADRGFIVEEDVALRGASLVTPAFLDKYIFSSDLKFFAKIRLKNKIKSICVIMAK